MPSTRDIRRRIRSVRSTAQITKAMQMVASSKMRKAQEAALAGRPYGELLNRVLAEVTHHAGSFRDPLMEERPVHKRAVLVVSSDKGLCGALNGNLLREAARLDANSTVFITAGRKAAQFVARTGRQLAAEFTYHDPPAYSEARAIARFAQDLFLKGEVDHVDLLFTNFVSTLHQRPLRRTLLPVTEIRPVNIDRPGEEPRDPLDLTMTQFDFEPSPEGVFSALLPHYVNFVVYQVMLEARASEHSARMVAMKNATDNARQLIKDLTLEYNKMRQAAITKELLEIATATMVVG